MATGLQACPPPALLYRLAPMGLRFLDTGALVFYQYEQACLLLVTALFNYFLYKYFLMWSLHYFSHLFYTIRLEYVIEIFDSQHCFPWELMPLAV